MTSAQPNKDTVYIDVDDEITTIIDKIRGGDGRIVALVLPKRAAVLQSIVNMKLLKRSAEQEKKQLVLITNETALLPLAGAVGVHVAGSLQSKPEIPSAPNHTGTGQPEEESLSLDDEPDEEITTKNAGNKSVGELANKSGKGIVITAGVETENDLAEASKAADPLDSVSTSAKSQKKHNKKLLVPNFSRFRLGLTLAIAGLLLLIGFIYLALVVLPKATVSIATNAQDVNSSIGFSLDTTASELDIDTANVPATAVQQQKTYTKEVDTTGEQNNGKKAEGNVTFSVCVDWGGSIPNDIGPGTGVTSGGMRYVTQDYADFPNNPNGSCAGGKFEFRSNKVKIIALDGGSDHNLNNATFQSDTGPSGAGSASGGTDDITKVVSQKDINTAKKQVDTKDPAIREALKQQLAQDGLFGVESTFQASDPNVSSSAQPGDKADKVTVTISITYTMFGTARSNLAALIKDDISEQVDIEKQSILSDGLDSANFSVEDISDTRARMTLDSTATVGPKLNQAAIKQQVAGKKNGEAKDIINQLPGVTDTRIKLSPFWVSGIPKNVDKIIIEVDKAASGN